MDGCPIYYINLNRRKDRRASLENEFSMCNIPESSVVRFEAIDGDTYQLTPEEMSLFEHSDYKRSPNARYIMGNQLSHIGVLRQIVSSEAPLAIVMQDDCKLHPEFLTHVNSIIADMPHDAEMVNIGFHKYAAYHIFREYDLSSQLHDHYSTPVNDHVAHLKACVNPCSTAYIVTRDGARAILEHICENGCRRATDWVFNEYLQSKNIFYGSRLVLCTGCDMGSDVWVHKRRRYERIISRHFPVPQSS